MNENYGTDALVALAASLRELANEFIVKSLVERGVKDILPAHGSVFAALFRKNPMHMSELASDIGRKKNTVTSLINTLEERGYCMRMPDPGDARAQLVHLTRRGKALRGVMEDISADLQDKLWEGVDEEDRQACVRVLRAVIGNMGG